MKVVLETPRLILREWTPDDAADFFRLNSDPQVMRFVPDEPVQSVDDARAILVSHPIKDYRERGFGRCACILKVTGENIGFCGLKYLKEIEAVDLGFRFLPAHWGKGFATEAAKPWVEYGFSQLGLEEIFGFAEPENGASIRVLEKVGMQFTGNVTAFGMQMRRYVIRRSDANLCG